MNSPRGLVPIDIPRRESRRLYLKEIGIGLLGAAAVALVTFFYQLLKGH